MPRGQTVKTSNNTIPKGLRAFARNRVLECVGILTLCILASVTIGLATWSEADPSWSHAHDGDVLNALGRPGAVLADKLISWLGIATGVLIAIPSFWAVALITHQRVSLWAARFWSAIGALALFAAAFSMLPVPSAWRARTGLGGSLGDIISNALVKLPAMLLFDWLANALVFVLCTPAAVWLAFAAIGISPAKLWQKTAPMRQRISSGSSAIFGWLDGRIRARSNQEAADYAPPRRSPRIHLEDDASIDADASAGMSLISKLRRRADTIQSETQDAVPSFLAKNAPLGEDRIEPQFTDTTQTTDQPQPKSKKANHPSSTTQSKRVQSAAGPLEAGKNAKKAGAGRSGGKFELPSLDLLQEPKGGAKDAQLSPAALEQNARMLEGVLDDFGVRGEIINVRPGPVVTLYELEPAPGIKSSRIVGLADDIARSMSAVSVRVAVIPGRNVIGIELPNSSRETVFLRELLGSRDFEKAKHKLCMALGKDIGGGPAFADLSRMPHLLIAGTTGSGKSVGINTMILSLLFRLPPEKCKLIMIDPKMLELSVYEGIPHLLAPVVTDPHKAVIALKWAVREMEERYRRMSKLGVRNVDGYNARAEQALKKGEVFTRQIQTGFDPETGSPIYEEETMDLSPMPYIVVIIDEMADLMMVAGKDIEGAVQRLAQMARAAGIHVIMATQRPSVDVITGTIKANFPTRISFQVTSKIDSRTILGEQGAEQLLGQGDMLFMAGGGRISRLHGPFVSDQEVEDIVAFLKAQQAPDYIDAVTEDTGESTALGPAAGVGGNSGDELYDKAVAVILRDRKVSTSYVQRRLSIGYNKAASLIERMEEEGLISAANNAGKREILAGADAEG